MQDLVHPPIEFRPVSENAAPRRTVHPVNWQMELRFPAPAGSFGTPEICGDLFPGLEEVVFRHQPGPLRNVESHTAWIVARIGAADHKTIVILGGRLAQMIHGFAIV
jgi:hypothetical protein